MREDLKKEIDRLMANPKNDGQYEDWMDLVENLQSEIENLESELDACYDELAGEDL